MNIKNIIAATYAPMKKDGALNLELIGTYGNFLKSNKVTGVFVNGSTGDFASLTVKERKLIIEEWSEKKPKGFILVNHVGHTSLKVAKDLASHSSDKVDAISALSPYYFKPRSLQCLVDYCKEIAACAPSLPFYYYHIPELTGANFSMVDFLELASGQIPNLAGIKFTENNVVDFLYCKNFNMGKYNILYGVDEMFLSSLPYGATGWVGSTYNHLSPLYYKILEAFNHGNHELASLLQLKSMQFIDILNNRGGFNGTGKSFMKVLGIDFGPSRFPHKTLSDAELKDVTQLLENLDIMKFTNNFDGI